MIKATFKNIGPIKDAKLELGDLTIIAGQNNTGKTYLVYTLYGFLSILEKQQFFLIRSYSGKEFLNKIDKISNQIEETGVAEMDLEEYKKLRNRIIKEESSIFSSKLLNQVFSSPNGEFKNANFFLKAEYSSSTVENAVHVRHNKSVISLKSYIQGEKLIFELNNSEDTQTSGGVISRGLILLFRKIIQKSYPEPFVLSAERFGISLFYKELDFTKNRLVEELQKLSDEKRKDPLGFLEKESARYAQPIKDNIDFTRDLSQIQRQRGEVLIDKFHSVDKMMDGYYKVKNDEIRFISWRKGNNRFDIPLHLSSSSARGVSDLYFYLKHIAEQGQILIIDEPESHLSPTNQVLMARLLVFCVNSGLKVLITTHSDYLIKEINNLIMLNGGFNGKSAFLKKHKKDYTEDDHLNPDSVKAYICKDGKLQSCSVDKTGIDMPVFDDAIDKINQTSMELALLTAPDDL